MNDYLRISNINDFIFCPVSIYFHNLYDNLDNDIYTDSKQLNGKRVHRTIDNKGYSNRKDVLQGITIYSEKYKLLGKIDLFYLEKGELVERKNKIITIYDGYVFQLYAQFYCLIEMGYDVRSIGLYSYMDNKKYTIALPDQDMDMRDKFFNTINKINNFDLNEYIQTSKTKCDNCIYSNSCDRSLV